jgi:4-amino-4-deoxy-L-arabinose transferase-like glycosyltransferase
VYTAPVLRRGSVVFWVVVVGAAWRLLLTSQYAGWEESDYGNLAMIRGVLDSGFRHYDMNHMPGYYALGAAALGLVGDAVVAARGVSLLGGLVALGLATAITRQLAGPRAAALAGLLLIFQPEFALYAASSLREPVYAAFVMGALLSLSRERLVLAGLLVGLGFLVRFDAALALAPALLVHALGRPGRTRRLVQVFAPLALIIGLWSLYCRIDHGTFLFWSHAVSVNVETGLGEEAQDTAEWILAGLRVSASLLGGLLPHRVGWGIWLAGIASVAWLPWRKHSLHRTLALAAGGMLGVWAGIGFVGQHDPVHNLYWKWLCPIIPVIVPLGVVGLLDVARLLPKRLGQAAAVVVTVQALGAGLVETHRQWALSEAWYRPQLDLAQDIEARIPESVPLLLDNIPACWINRRHHERELTSWFDVPSVAGSEADFSRWLLEREVGHVLWFREEWTQAPLVAPFLAEGGEWRGEGVRLVERSREDGYGWIWFEVEVSP